jgi:hypothetical protein
LISEYDIPEDIRSILLHLADGKERNVTLSVLFRTLLQWCRISEKPLVLIIDELPFLAEPNPSMTSGGVFL